MALGPGGPVAHHRDVGAQPDDGIEHADGFSPERGPPVGRDVIAKFPHHTDEWDVMLWEKTMLDLAHEAGLRVPRSRLTKVGARKRAPARTPTRWQSSWLHQCNDDARCQGRRRARLRRHRLVLPESGAAVKDDLAELFARVVFNVAVHNTDDHLRNHGFLRQRGGWSFSPLFDVNPNPDLSRRRVTSVLGAVDAEDEVKALLDLARACRLSPDPGKEVIRRVIAAVGQWRAGAAGKGATAGEITVFADAIETQLAALTKLTAR